MHFISTVIFDCTFYPIYAQVSFFCAYFCLPVGDRYAFYKRAAFMEDICNAKSRHIFMPAFC